MALTQLQLMMIHGPTLIGNVGTRTR